MGGILIVPAKRIADGKKLFVALQSVPLSARRDSVGFFYKELASYADYSTAHALGSNWKKGLRVTDESSCYSTMVLMKNQRIGFLYEVRGQNDGYDIEFKKSVIEGDYYGEYDILPYVDRSKYMVDAAKAHQTKAPLSCKKKQVKRKK